MSYLICIAAYGLLWVINSRSAIKKWWLIAALAAIGGCSFANTGIGGWCAGMLRTILGLPASWFGASAAMLAAIVALLMIVMVGYDIGKDHKTDRPAMVGLALLPMLFAIAAGPIGTGGVKVSDAIANIGTHGLTLLGG
jgi:uncharacterized membrane protein